MKLFFFFFFINTIFYSQNNIKYPIVENCETKNESEIENCFKEQFYNHLLTNEKIKTIQSGSLDLIFEISEQSKIEILYINGLDLISQNKFTAVLEQIKILKPAYNLAKPVVSIFKLKLDFPLKSENIGTVFDNQVKKFENISNIKNNQNKNFFFNNHLKESNDLVDLNNKFFDNNLYNTNINIPFTHYRYNEFDASLNIVGQNSHTSSKPFIYNDISKYYDFKKQESNFTIKKNTWFGRKLFNENLVEISGKGYWFTINPVFNLQIGKDSNTSSFTYLNTRALSIQGQINGNLSFTTTLFETQGFFANYYNQYAQSIKPGGGNPAVIPGIGAAKEFKKTAFDIPSADALISYNANEFININLGYGRNFIGDGYRSMFLSDGASPYTFVKINTSFWKIKYTNIYGWLKDVRPEALIEGSYTTKYMATHYLSWNVNKRLNIGFFESVIWSNTNNRGFEANFLNPIIFYRSVEFASSPKTGNALLGLSMKYKFNNQFSFYGQFLIDEFAVNDVVTISGSWRNKFAYQTGIKYFNAFNIKNLNLQLEYNKVRPYVYSHSNIATNYAHYNQSLGHNWGSNFQELIFLARYNQKRWNSELKITFAKRGFDFNNSEDNYNYGSNIYKDYDEDRYSNFNVYIGQGLLRNQIIIENQLKYLLNYKTNLSLFTSIMYRNITNENQNNLWISFGVKSEMFNWYFDY